MNDNTIESRIQCNKFTAGILRRRLEQRHSKGTRTRDLIDRFSDKELVEVYFRNEQQAREHVAKRLDASEGSE